jgi:hypothetical protein
MVLPSALPRMASLMREAEITVDAVLASLCWIAAGVLYSHGKVAMESVPPLPHSAAAAAALGTQVTMNSLATGACGVVALGAACVIAITAAEGTWSVLKRIGAGY